MVDEIDARLRVLNMLHNPALASLDFDQAQELVSLARQAIAAGVAGYTLLTAEKPA